MSHNSSANLNNKTNKSASYIASENTSKLSNAQLPSLSNDTNPCSIEQIIDRYKAIANDRTSTNLEYSDFLRLNYALESFSTHLSSGSGFTKYALDRVPNLQELQTILVKAIIDMFVLPGALTNSNWPQVRSLGRDGAKTVLTAIDYFLDNEIGSTGVKYDLYSVLSAFLKFTCKAIPVGILIFNKADKETIALSARVLAPICEIPSSLLRAITKLDQKTKDDSKRAKSLGYWEFFINNLSPSLLYTSIEASALKQGVADQVACLYKSFTESVSPNKKDHIIHYLIPYTPGNTLDLIMHPTMFGKEYISRTLQDLADTLVLATTARMAADATDHTHKLPAGITQAFEARLTLYCLSLIENLLNTKLKSIPNQRSLVHVLFATFKNVSTVLRYLTVFYNLYSYGSDMHKAVSNQSNDDIVDVAISAFLFTTVTLLAAPMPVTLGLIGLEALLSNTNIYNKIKCDAVGRFVNLQSCAGREPNALPLPNAVVPGIALYRLAHPLQLQRASSLVNSILVVDKKQGLIRSAPILKQVKEAFLGLNTATEKFEYLQRTAESHYQFTTDKLVEKLETLKLRHQDAISTDIKHTALSSLATAATTIKYCSYAYSAYSWISDLSESYDIYVSSYSKIAQKQIGHEEKKHAEASANDIIVDSTISNVLYPVALVSMPFSWPAIIGITTLQIIFSYTDIYTTSKCLLIGWFVDLASCHNSTVDSNPAQINDVLQTLYCHHTIDLQSVTFDRIKDFFKENHEINDAAIRYFVDSARAFDATDIDCADITNDCSGTAPIHDEF